ncbi:MAG: tripartite tricarboxylate transporter permease, partial [Sedimentibacter sp.]
MTDILSSISILSQPMNLLVLFFGTILGFTGGAIPGISGTMLVVLLVPLTYTLDATTALLSLITVYCAAVFGGSISAILFRTPGAPESVATTLDGYPMTLKGESALALGVSVFCSAIGGIIGSIFLITLTPQLAKFALKFGPVEYFGLSVMALSVVSSLGDDNQLKSIISSLIGLLLMTIGIDPMTGLERFTFGSSWLMSGIDFIPILIGLFAVSETFRRFEQDTTGIKKDVGKIKTTFPDLKLIKRLFPIIAKSSLLGTVIGILPGIGATTASMVSYSEAVRSSKTPELFGTGIPEGVAAPETANNAAACGAIIPLIALGIPGSATTAVMLGAFILHGIVPGPLIFVEQRPLV